MCAASSVQGDSQQQPGGVADQGTQCQGTGRAHGQGQEVTVDHGLNVDQNGLPGEPPPTPVARSVRAGAQASAGTATWVEKR